MVNKYQKRISGPLLVRIDIHIEVPRVNYAKLSNDRLGKNSAAIQARAGSAPATAGTVCWKQCHLQCRYA
jgi:magnesium chelatase family protein